MQVSDLLRLGGPMLDEYALSDSDLRIFRSRKSRAMQIADEESAKTDDYETALRASRVRVRQECGSIIGMMIISLLVNLLAKYLWDIYKRRHPSKYTGSPPHIEFADND
jgi:hypothetical protein